MNWYKEATEKLEELTKANSLTEKEQDRLKRKAEAMAAPFTKNVWAAHVTSAWNYLVTRELI